MSTAAPIDAMSPDALRERAGEFLAHDRWPRERLLAHQRVRLRALREHAVSRSRYYREALGPDAVHADLADLPTLPKPVMMEQFDRVVTDPRLRRAELEAFLAEADAGKAYLGEYRVFSTAGTTGVPGLCVFSQGEFAHWIAVSLAALARVGVSPRTRFVAVGAPSAFHVTRQLFAASRLGDRTYRDSASRRRSPTRSPR
jgi:phenylacetate-CoA ligase